MVVRVGLGCWAGVRANRTLSDTYGADGSTKDYPHNIWAGYICTSPVLTDLPDDLAAADIVGIFMSSTPLTFEQQAISDQSAITELTDSPIIELANFPEEGIVLVRGRPIFYYLRIQNFNGIVSIFEAPKLSPIDSLSFTETSTLYPCDSISPSLTVDISSIVYITGCQRGTTQIQLTGTPLSNSNSTQTVNEYYNVFIQDYVQTTDMDLLLAESIGFVSDAAADLKDTLITIGKSTADGFILFGTAIDGSYDELVESTPAILESCLVAGYVAVMLGLLVGVPGVAAGCLAALVGTFVFDVGRLYGEKIIESLSGK